MKLNCTYHSLSQSKRFVWENTEVYEGEMLHKKRAAAKGAAAPTESAGKQLDALDPNLEKIDRACEDLGNLFKTNVIPNATLVKDPTDAPNFYRINDAKTGVTISHVKIFISGGIARFLLYAPSRGNEPLETSDATPRVMEVSIKYAVNTFRGEANTEVMAKKLGEVGTLGTAFNKDGVLNYPVTMTTQIAGKGFSKEFYVAFREENDGSYTYVVCIYPINSKTLYEKFDPTSSDPDVYWTSQGSDVSALTKYFDDVVRHLVK